MSAHVAPIRALYMGTADFAVEPLRALATECTIVGVFTRPDSVSRRGNKTHPSPVRELANDLGLGDLVHTPATLRSEESVELVRALNPDVIVVAAYGVLLPKAVLDIPSLGCVNVHGSLLPAWRGAAPIERAILAGDEVTGVCIMQMEEGLDTGATCACASTTVAGKSRDELAHELSLMGAELLVPALEHIASGTATWTPQDGARATYAHKLEKGELDLNPTLTVAQAIRRVNASSAHAPCRMSLAGLDLVVLNVDSAGYELPTPDAQPLTPGGVEIRRRGIAIGLADGPLLLTRVKPAGKSAMEASAWGRGARLPKDATWQ